MRAAILLHRRKRPLKQKILQQMQGDEKIMDSANDPWATNEAAQKTIHDTESCDDLLDLLLTIENRLLWLCNKKSEGQKSEN